MAVSTLHLAFATTLAAAVVVALNILSALHVSTLAYDFRSDWPSLLVSQKNEQHPLRIPVKLPLVALMVESNELYDLDADDEWDSLTPAGFPFGFVRMGDDARPFDVSVYHQVHCLDGLRHALIRYNWTTAENDADMLWHVTHCLNMVRQSILCQADTTLEPSHFYRKTAIHGNESAASGMDVLHVCKDWTRVRKYAEENYQATWSIPLHVSDDDKQRIS